MSETEEQKGIDLAAYLAGLITWEEFSKNSANEYQKGYHAGYQAATKFALKSFADAFEKKEEEDCDCCEPDCPICQAKKEQMDQDYQEMMDLQMSQI